MAERYERGLRKLNEIDKEQVGRIIAGPQDIAPDFARYLIEFPFGDIYTRPGLDLRARQIATVAALTALGTAMPQLKVHIHGALNVGCTHERKTPNGNHLRLAVITTGQRVPIGGPLRVTLQRLHRTISRWSSEAAQLFGIDVVYRGSEFTVDAAATFHPHANVIYAPRKPLSKEQWSSFLAWSYRRLGAHWKDCGKLAQPDEAIKYPFKPTDLRGLPPAALAWLCRELERLKLAQPMGSFAAFWRHLEHESEKIAFVADQRSGQLQRIKKRRREPMTATEHNRETENILIARTAPMPKHSPWWEPCSIVKNFMLSPKTEGGAFRLRILEDRQRRAREAWDANGGPAPSTALDVARGENRTDGIPG
jgi:alkylhydroperoxidase/carboxymuconolactone decarboxylase family protein YurZ